MTQIRDYVVKDCADTLKGREKLTHCDCRGGRVGTKDVLDPNFIVLLCPFNLLHIFKDGAHRSKTEFMLGPGSGVKLTSDTDIPRPPSMRLQRLPQWWVARI